MPKKNIIRLNRPICICALLIINTVLISLTAQNYQWLSQIQERFLAIKGSSTYLNDQKRMVEDMLNLTRSEIEEAIVGYVDQKMINPTDLLNNDEKNEQ